MGKLLEQIVDTDNMYRALECMNLNACSGIDRQRPRALKQRFPYIRQGLTNQILDGSYNPSPLLRIFIPKKNKDNEYRMLGIPTSKDRLIQLAIVQVVEPLYRNDFSQYSYGFMKGRDCYQALQNIRDTANRGKSYAVSIDLKKFFDNVPHQSLMKILQKKIDDKALLELIYKYLITSAFEFDAQGNKHKVAIDRGVPQGGPLSPLLSNIALNELDNFLEQNKISFSRYADDCMILTGLLHEAHHIFDVVSEYIERDLELEINYDKSYICDITESEYLGFSFKYDKHGYSFDVSAKKFTVLKERIMSMVCEYYEKVQPKAFVTLLMSVTRGWINYYSLADISKQLAEIDDWFEQEIITHQQYKYNEFYNSYNELILSGVDSRTALSMTELTTYINKDAVQIKGIYPRKHYQWLLDAGYKTCTQLYTNIIQRRTLT